MRIAAPGGLARRESVIGSSGAIGSLGVADRHARDDRAGLRRLAVGVGELVVVRFLVVARGDRVVVVGGERVVVGDRVVVTDRVVVADRDLLDDDHGGDRRDGDRRDGDRRHGDRRPGRRRRRGGPCDRRGNLRDRRGGDLLDRRDGNPADGDRARARRHFQTLRAGLEVGAGIRRQVQALAAGEMHRARIGTGLEEARTQDGRSGRHQGAVHADRVQRHLADHPDARMRGLAGSHANQQDAEHPRCFLKHHALPFSSRL